MKPIQYFGIHACKQYGFPYIYAELTTAEQAPDYESEPNGIAELEKVLNFVQNDTYYPTFEEKCAYLICSIAGSQYFSNGNKRLSVTILMMFLQLNDARVFQQKNVLQELLKMNFPEHLWEDNPSIQRPHSLFLYNLAVVLGDRTKWPSEDFGKMREFVAKIFTLVYLR